MLMFEEMLQRTTSEKVIEFVKYGTECMPKEKLSAERRVSKAEDCIMGIIEQKFSDFNNRDTLEEIVNAALAEIEDVYFEMGFKTGATTLLSILGK